MPRYATGAHGEYAGRPRDIPRKGWIEVGRRILAAVSRDNLTLISAGVAFYGLMAVFPAIAALVMMFGLVADPQAVVDQMAAFEDVIPPQAFAVLVQQLKAVAAQSSGQLGLGLLLSLVLALWSATKGSRAVMTAMNIIYGEIEKRAFFHQNAVALAFTLAGVLFAAFAVAAIALVPAIVSVLPLPGGLEVLLIAAQWVVMALLAMVAMGLIYRHGPNRRRARFRWVSPGAMMATVLWLVASGAFSVYVANFASYNETFGSLGAAVVLLMWFWLSALILCLGAELNAQLELQTWRDTTVGFERPRGERHAYVAEHGPADHPPRSPFADRNSDGKLDERDDLDNKKET